MIERLRVLLLLSLTTALFGCAPEKEEVTYFGGKIINPKTDHVILFFEDEAIDTFYLDNSHSFLSKVDITKEGLFYFKHGPEHQYVYLEPQDSVLIRLNTWNFDETLVFSGKGADRNNMLIDCFIDAEKDERKFYKLYQLEPKEFKSKVNVLHDMKMRRYNQFVERNKNETDQFKNVLKMALTYPLFSKVERYPLAKREQTHTLRLNDLDSTFYNHRADIALNKDSIMFFYAYRDFVTSHLYNKVFSEGHDINSDAFTLGLLSEIDANISYEHTKNAMLRQIAIGHFYRKSSCNVNKEAFTAFFKMSTSEEDKLLIGKLLEDVKNIHTGKKLKSFGVYDFNNTQHNISSVIKGKNSVLYFWNPVYMSKEYVASKVRYLTKKYPEVNFVGIKINDGKIDRINKLDIKTQFYLNDRSSANKFLTSAMPRTILVNKKGVVVNGFASLSSQKIYNQIGDLAKN